MAGLLATGNLPDIRIDHLAKYWTGYSIYDRPDTGSKKAVYRSICLVSDKTLGIRSIRTFIISLFNYFREAIFLADFSCNYLQISSRGVPRSVGNDFFVMISRISFVCFFKTAMLLYCFFVTATITYY